MGESPEGELREDLALGISFHLEVVYRTFHFYLDPERGTDVESQLYVVLWIFDLIPMFPPLAFLAMLLHARWFPPSPAERLAQSKDRSLRAAHATELSKQLKTSNRFSFAFEGAKNLVHDLTKSSSSSQPGVLARGLGGSATLAGMAGGLKIVDEVEKSKTTRTTKSKSSAEGEDVSVYRLASDLTEVFGPPIQEGMGQVSDIAEKIKKYVPPPSSPFQF